MAGAIVMHATKVKTQVTKYEVTWVSDASGNVSGSTFTLRTGTMIAVEFVPGPGAFQPDNLYDADLTDELGVSLFDDGAGTTIGANMSNVVAVHRIPLSGLTPTTVFRRWHPGGLVQPLIAGAGDSNAGTINIYMVDGVL